jgi:hypothetical protein
MLTFQAIQDGFQYNDKFTNSNNSALWCVTFPRNLFADTDEII